MINTITYQTYDADGILGQLVMESGSTYSFLTHAYQNEDGSYSPVTPPGEYSCVRGTHQLLHSGPFTTFEVTGVTGHTGVLFHVGNYNRDSEGCFLLGDAESGDMVTDSRDAFTKFMAELEGVDTFTLVVKGA